MAKVITTTTRTEIVKRGNTWWTIAIVGAVMGLFYVWISALVNYFIVEPLYCKTLTDASVCVNSVSIAGNIATILIATIGLIILLRLRTARPIIVIAAAALTLWGLSSWTNGLAVWEIIVWSIVLYALTYTTYWWISLYDRTITALLAVTLVVACARIALIS
jgi:hypothetical protein